jgi:hypothetical protein
MKDLALFFRTTTDSLTATETSAYKDLGSKGRPIPLTVLVDIPKQSVGDTIKAKLLQSDNGTTAIDDEDIELFLIASVTGAITAPVQKRRHVTPNHRYVALEMVVAGTSPDYGAVKAALDLAGTSFRPDVGSSLT